MPPRNSPPAKPPGGARKSPPGKDGKGKPSPSRKPPGDKGGGLNKKVGGLPVWAWGALVLAAVGLGLYLRSRSGGSTAVAQPDSSTPTDPGSGSAGGGDTTGADNSALSGAIEDLVNQLGAGVAPPDGEPSGDVPGSPAVNTALAGFWWGGQYFTKRSTWEAYAKSHGINLQTFYHNHPQASKDLGVNPPPNVAAPHKAAKAAKPQSKPQKATKNTAHPVSSHPAAAALHLATPAAAIAKPAAKPAAPKPTPASLKKSAPPPRRTAVKAR